MSKYQPTNEQLTAINSTHHKITISASAGSGKTTTMIERIANVLKMKSATLAQILVLTFTDASAKDMRQKLGTKLAGIVSPVDLQAAEIGTFHGFCAKLVRAWFTVADVSPMFEILDPIAAKRLQIQVCDQVINDHYAACRGIIDFFLANRQMEDLRKAIIETDNFLASRHDRQAWLNNVALSCYDPNVATNPAVQALLDDYHTLAHDFRQAIIDAGDQGVTTTLAMQIIAKILAAKTYEDFTKLGELALKPIKVDESCRKLYEALRDKLCKPLNATFTVSAAQLSKDILADRELAAQLLMLVNQYHQLYQQKKHDAQQLDFTDLETYALKVLADPAATTSIRAQYKYIFVDEGQDTNPVQFSIIDKLRGDDKFFYIVGDVKQSIYGFRHCEPEEFAQMSRETAMQLIPFNKNWRSTDPILKYVNDVMTPLMCEPNLNYQVDHRFVLAAQPTPDAINQAVRVEVVPPRQAHPDSQAELVYQQIKHAAFPYAEIAVLAETAKPLFKLREYLEARGIPCVVDKAVNALDVPAIKLLNNFLFAAMNPTNEMACYLVMQYLYQIDTNTLARIKLGQCSLPENVATDLATFHQHVREKDTATVLKMVAAKFAMLDTPEVDAYLTAVQGVKDFDTVARYLYLLEHDLIQIEINPGANVTNAVRLMTIHGAKGLEFPMVILYNCGSDWERRHRDHKLIVDKHLGVCVLSVDPETYVKRSPVLRLGIAKKQRLQNIAENKRLLYVALTRPQKYLYIVGKWQKPWLRNRYNCMLDMLYPQFAPVRDDVTPSPVNKKNQSQVYTPLVKLQHPSLTKIEVKQSVTRLSQPEAVVDYVPKVRFDDAGGKEFGTAFHKQMQYGELPPAVAALVAGYTQCREMPFLYTLDDGSIVQGIMDLVAIKGHDAIIVDYKTTRLPVPALIEKYRAQLQYYARALPGYQVRTYLYSTVHNQLIAVL